MMLRSASLLNAMARRRTDGGVAFGFCALLASLLLVSTTSAQYRIDHWTADDGLPQNSVYGIVQSLTVSKAR